MKPKTALLATVATLIVLALISTPLAARQAGDQVLTAGDYSAKVKAIVCGGCGPLIQKTMQGVKGIGAVTVDQEKMAVQFTVKKDGAVKLSELQKVLKTAAGQMGMGADYILSEVKPLKKK